mmetsp:Transcript_28521/g.92485  ORF Transcript_28521/g.92485 Transcript_28521/m.92485 type:complete len:218 (+) Transcript_28521:160-813(+)
MSASARWMVSCSLRAFASRSRTAFTYSIGSGKGDTLVVPEAMTGATQAKKSCGRNTLAVPSACTASHGRTAAAAGVRSASSSSSSSSPSPAPAASAGIATLPRLPRLAALALLSVLRARRTRAPAAEPVDDAASASTSPSPSPSDPAVSADNRRRTPAPTLSPLPPRPFERRSRSGSVGDLPSASISRANRHDPPSRPPHSGSSLIPGSRTCSHRRG